MNREVYENVFTNFFENPLWKIVIGAIATLFNVPITFVIAVPIFWVLDFISGVYASKRKGEKFSTEKVNAQYIKFGLHIVFLIGCVIISNLYSVEAFIKIGFGYIIGTEFVSMVGNAFGEKEGSKVLKKFKTLLFDTFGITFEDDENRNKEE